MAKGAAATARAYRARNTVRHPGKPRLISVNSGSATAIRGGTGPVNRSNLNLRLASSSNPIKY